MLEGQGPTDCDEHSSFESRQSSDDGADEAKDRLHVRRVMKTCETSRTTNTSLYRILSFFFLLDFTPSVLDRSKVISRSAPFFQPFLFNIENLSFNFRSQPLPTVKNIKFLTHPLPTKIIPRVSFLFLASSFCRLCLWRTRICKGNIYPGEVDMSVDRRRGQEVVVESVTMCRQTGEPTTVTCLTKSERCRARD